MNRLDTRTRSQVISCLVDGCSIRATVRITGVCKKAVLRLLVEVGQVCADYQDRVFRNLTTKRIQVDEMWSWITCKQKNVTPKIAAKNPHAGDVWLWIAIDADTKLVLSHMVGSRTPPTAYDFMLDVASRIKFDNEDRPAERRRVQLTTDGLYWYVDAVDHAFGADVDYAMQQKQFGSASTDKSAALRYSPTKITSVTTEVIKGLRQ